MIRISSVAGSRLAFALLAVAGTGVVAPLIAQEPITLREAVAEALRAGPSVGLARADSAAARAAVGTARAFPNPSLVGGYTRDVPRYHGAIELPLEYPWVRGPRIRAATREYEAMNLRLELRRSRVRRDVTVAYAAAAGAEAMARLSQRTAREGEELQNMVRARLEAGDASELDASLASIAASRLANEATRDSLRAVAAVLALQLRMGRPADRVTVRLADSLGIPPPVAPRETAAPLRVSVAETELRARQAALAAQRRGRIAPPTLQAGAEGRDPGGETTGLLPTLELAIPLPIFNRNGAAVQSAEASVRKARWILEVEKRESSAAIADALRLRETTRRLLERDRRVLQDAERVAEMTATAYREGAMSLPNVLEARRASREAIADYLEDLVRAWVAEADLELATRGVAQEEQP